MKKALVALLVVAVVLSLCATAVSAKPEKPITPGEVKQLTLVFYEKADNPGKPDRPPGKPERPPGKPEPEPEPSFVLIGFKLYEPATYYVNAEGSGVDPDEVKAAISASFETWDAVTAAKLFKDKVEPTDLRGRDFDGQNTISWVRIVPPKVVALCTIWYEGELDPDNPAEILEFDICFNTKYDWDTMADGANPDAFIIENVATHEAGHPVGLDDLKEDENSEQTMYGYTTEGETIKISLHPDGDILGAQELYG